MKFNLTFAGRDLSGIDSKDYDVFVSDLVSTYSWLKGNDLFNIEMKKVSGYFPDSYDLELYLEFVKEDFDSLHNFQAIVKSPVILDGDGIEIYDDYRE